MDALDTDSLRVALGVVVAVALVLFYAVTYRATRASYALLWCVALLAITTGTGAFLATGTPLQACLLPVGNGLLLGGATALYAGARALDGRRTSWWVLVMPLAAASITALDSPGRNDAAGDWAFLLLMGLVVGVTGAQMWVADGPRAGLRRTMAYAIGFVAGFYLTRWTAFVVLGPDDPTYADLFGPQTATLVNLAVLVGAVFSMTALSTEQQMRDLHSRATRDGLTKLLNRDEFERLAAVSLDRMRQAGIDGTLVLSDLDHFKSVNDTYGHDVGDRVLCAFADACRSVVRASDLVARFGGEEFVILLPGSSPSNAERVVRDIRARLCEETLPGGVAVTASYGAVPVGRTASLADVVSAADAALYRAKKGGRDRLVHGSTDGVTDEMVELA